MNTARTARRTLSKLRAELNAVAVSLEDLLRARDVIHALPDGQKGILSRIVALQGLWVPLPPIQRARKIQAVDYRLCALARLAEAGKLPGWSYPEGIDGGIPVSQAAWRMAAEAPLVWTAESEEPTFDAEAILLRLLRETSAGNDQVGH